jgi:glycosyltransferase involved in cell wall biosynthesis
MKIAIYHNLSSGGAKRSLYEIVRRLSTRHELSVFSLSSADHDFCDIRALVKSYHIYPFKPAKLLGSPFGRINSIIRTVDLKRLRRINEIIAKDIENEKPDVIFVEPCRFENAPSILRYILEFPSIYYCHEPYRVLYESLPPRPYFKNASKVRQSLNKIDPFLQYYTYLAKDNDYRNIRKAKKVLVNSAYTKSQVKEIYQLEAEVNYLGIDTTKFKPLPHIDKSNFILSVGSLTPLKGFDFIIRSIALIPSSFRPKLVISSNFSNPEEHKFLQETANQYHVEVHFLNRIPDEKLVNLYNSAIATAYTPHREPFGLVALESMACATPIVGVKEGGLLETIQDHKTGRLVERNEQAFSMALEEILRNPQLAYEYGQNGFHEVSSKWDWDTSVRNFETTLTKAVYYPS